MEAMPKASLLKITCPCCQATLFVDPETSAVIRYEEHVKPREIEDMEQAVQRFRGEKDRRDSAFEKSVAEHKSHKDVLAKKFDEMLRVARENPDAPPPKRDIDFD